MENLEEVLQALDEFQKMRPTEIPRELEDYLCWVAKTGDPVYQWSLIKTLFREKLTRVMSDFYESCPTLELAPCPNVEHFNYDTMKSNLLDRLESFANAPFTVQRICELLTAPRKEYNRVDKFMRAIEKNILVVSTREPGPIARRSENGDGMVNGSVDEDASVTQPPQDVEMEYWEKDCPSTVTISVHTVENETPLLHAVIPGGNATKGVFGNEESSQEKIEPASTKAEMPATNFIPTTSEFSGASNLTSQAQSQETPIASNMQSLPTIVPEGNAIVGDVPEAIMNEDTSSQPSLDLENEDSEGADSTRKLQTTFQAKDFTLGDNKSPKFYLDGSKPGEKDGATAAQAEEEENVVKMEDVQAKTNLEVKTSTENKEAVGEVAENPPQATNGKLEDKKSDAEEESMETTVEESDRNVEEKGALAPESSSVEDAALSSSSENMKSFKSYPMEKNTTVPSGDCMNNLILPTGDTMHRIPQTETENNETATVDASGDAALEVEESKEQNSDADTTEDVKPIIEEPPSKDSPTESYEREQEKDGASITEAVGDEARVIKSMVPDPIPIVEEPKDPEQASEKQESSTTIVEISEETEEQNSTDCQPDSEEKLMSIETSGLTELQGNNVVTTIKVKSDDSSIEESSACKRGRNESVELMEVDDEETLSMFQQDEPMEQESAELSKS